MRFKREDQVQVHYDNGTGLVIRASARYVTLLAKDMQRFETRADLDDFVVVLKQAWEDRQRFVATYGDGVK